MHWFPAQYLKCTSKLQSHVEKNPDSQRMMSDVNTHYVRDCFCRWCFPLSPFAFRRRKFSSDFVCLLQMFLKLISLTVYCKLITSSLVHRLFASKAFQLLFLQFLAIFRLQQFLAICRLQFFSGKIIKS